MSRFIALLAVAIAAFVVVGGGLHSADRIPSPVALVDDGGNEWG